MLLGGSRLGFRSDGPGQTVPLDLHHSVYCWHLCNPLRSTLALRRHQTYRYGTVVRRSTTIFT